MNVLPDPLPRTSIEFLFRAVLNSSSWYERGLKSLPVSSWLPLLRNAESPYKLHIQYTKLEYVSLALKKIFFTDLRG